MQTCDALRIDDALLIAAGELQPFTVRSLDAIHLAAAARVGHGSRDAIVTYDQRMAATASRAGWSVSSPGSRP